MWTYWLFLLVLLIIIVTTQSINRENFVSNDSGYQTYLNNDGLITKINDMGNSSDYNNTHVFLETQLIPGNYHINQTKGYSQPNISSTYPIKDNRQWHFKSTILPQLNEILTIKQNKLNQPQQVGGSPAPYISQTNQFIKMLDKATLDNIKLVQPHFYNEIELNKFDNSIYYRDNRYPRDMVSTKFLKDEVAFCQKNYSQYPCYKWWAKQLSFKPPLPIINTQQ